MPGLTLTLALTIKIPVAGIAAFQQYEAGVLPLLSRYGGQLQYRMRNADGTVEVHLVRFATRAGFEQFRLDPHRAELAPLLVQSGAQTEMHEVCDVR